MQRPPTMYCTTRAIDLRTQSPARVEDHRDGEYRSLVNIATPQRGFRRSQLPVIYNDRMMQRRRDTDEHHAPTTNDFHLGARASGPSQTSMLDVVSAVGLGACPTHWFRDRFACH